MVNTRIYNKDIKLYYIKLAMFFAIILDLNKLVSFL